MGYPTPVVQVPTSAPTLLGTPHHLLINELMRSPDTLLNSINKLVRQAIDLDTGSFEASTTTIILYIVRLASRIDNYLSFLLQYDAGTHDSIRGKPYRQIELLPAVSSKLRACRAELRGMLWGDLRKVLHAWYHKLVKANDDADADDEVLDQNTRRMCIIHSQ